MDEDTKNLVKERLRKGRDDFITNLKNKEIYYKNVQSFEDVHPECPRVKQDLKPMLVKLQGLLETDSSIKNDAEKVKQVISGIDLESDNYSHYKYPIDDELADGLVKFFKDRLETDEQDGGVPKRTLVTIEIHNLKNLKSNQPAIYKFHH